MAGPAETHDHGMAADAAPRSRRGARKTIGDVLVWSVFLAIPLALVGGGGFMLYQRAFGTRVDATVLDCDISGTVVRGAATYRSDCIAEWTIDGRTVIGPFVGGHGESDIGKTVTATVRGGSAYSRSWGLPALLLGLGVPFFAFPVLAIRSRRRTRQTHVADSGDLGRPSST